MTAVQSTLGHEAIELATMAGQTLDTWQRAAVCDIFATQDDDRWAAVETRTTGASHAIGPVIDAVELAGLFLFDERLIVYSAHRSTAAREAFLRIRTLIDGCEGLSRHVKSIRATNGDQRVLLTTGASLRFLVRSKVFGRGFSTPRNVLDEAYEVTRPQLADVLPAMAAQPNPQLNLFFS